MYILFSCTVLAGGSPENPIPFITDLKGFLEGIYKGLHNGMKQYTLKYRSLKRTYKGSMRELRNMPLILGALAL